MATITLETAYTNQQHTAAAQTAAQQALNDLIDRQNQAQKDLEAAKSEFSAADATVLAVAQKTPDGSIAQTADGHLLLVIGGFLHVYTPVPAANVSGDDGTAPPPPPNPVPTPPPVPPQEPLAKAPPPLGLNEGGGPTVG